MRKTLFFLFFLCACALCRAQFHPSIEIGSHFAYIHNLDEQGIALSTGINAGLMVAFSQDISLITTDKKEMRAYDIQMRARVQYVQKGGRITYDILDTPTSYLFKMNYMEGALLFQYSHQKMLGGKLAIELGPSIGKLISSQLIENTPTVRTANEIEWDESYGINRQKVNKIDIGALIGLQYTFAGTASGYQFHSFVRYHHDFTDLTQYLDSRAEGDLPNENRGFSIGLAFSYQGKAN